MDKLNMCTKKGADMNIEKIRELFPNVVTERRNAQGKLEYGIDFELLKQELSEELIEGREERYQFTWPDKREAIRRANEPSTQCLRPCREESVEFDNTKNLYIEGDNLEVLKLLRENYLGKVKMIYIDPPYNTGNDFVYNDDFAESVDSFKERDGQKDEQGNRLFKNTDSNGRFHTDWLNMMYPRLKVARDLLSEDGVIFISIDDNEVDNLKKLCNEIFGERNFVAQLIWERAFSPKNDAKYISNSHDYVLICAKNIDCFVIGRLPRTEAANARYSNPDNDPRGVWLSDNITVKTYTESCDYPITTPSGRVVEPPTGRCWSLSKKAFLERLQDNRIWFGSDGNGVPRLKRFLSELKFDGMAPTSILFYKEVGHSQEGAQELSKLLEGGYFDGPKPTRLLERLLTLANLKEDSIVIDFFSGSSTTAHSVLKKNAEDGGNRRFIMVQLPELTDEKSEAYKAGYKNICEIGKERIRRAGKAIRNEELGGRNEELVDVGFRVLKLDSSNMKDVYYCPEEIGMGRQDLFEENIKEDRSAEDLLFQVMPELGIELSVSIRKEELGMRNGVEVFNVGDGYLMACFDNELDEEIITEIAKRKPAYFVTRDRAFGNDAMAVNMEQIFTKYSPDTVRRVI